MSNTKNAAANKGTSEIIRVKRLPSNFVQMHKGFFEDSRLSFKAKGILGYLLTKPDNWAVRVTDLMNHAKDGRDSVYAGLKELQEHGYYHRVQARDGKGRLAHWESFVCEVPFTAQDTDISAVETKYSYTSDMNIQGDTAVEKPLTETPFTEKPFTDKPHTEKPYTENPDTGKPYTENPYLSNNYITNNDFTKNDYNNNDFSDNYPTPTPPADCDSGEAENTGGCGENPKMRFAEFVSMTNGEYSSLVAKLGESGAKWCIGKLDNYKGSKGKKYDSDYRAILSWVVMRYQEHLQAIAEKGNGSHINHADSGDAYFVGYMPDISKTGDAFEDFVQKKIREAKQHGAI